MSDWQKIIIVASCIAILVISLIVGFRPISWILVPVSLVVMALIALLFTALGTAIASKLDDMQGFQLIMNFLIMPLFFLSGALFPLNQMPPALLLVAKFDPLSYGVDGLHYLLTGMGALGLQMDFLVLAIAVGVLLLIGSWLFSKIEI